MDLTEKKISSKELYRSPSYTFTLDTVRLPDGREHTREVFHHPGGVAVLAINEKGQVIVEHQYRYAVRQTILEIPAGKMDKIPGEKPEETALRELREETGLHLDHVDQVWKESYSAVGFANEKNICIVGTASGEILPSDSDMEEIEADWYTKAEIRALLNVARFAARTQAYCALWSRK